MILIGIIQSCNDDGSYTSTLLELSSFGVCCPETARSSLKKLQQADCLSVEPAQRGRGGTFEAKLYRLNLTNKRVRAMFELLRGPRDAAGAAMTPPDSPHPKSPAAGELRRQKNPRPHPKIGSGAYIGTRTHPGASSNIFFFHSLPADFEIEEALKPLVEKVLSVCGVGLADVRTPGLLESLVECLPEALDDEYDFELDILPCIKRKTSGHRIEPLWSFRIIFKNDLPEWKRNRIVKEQRRIVSARPERNAGNRNQQRSQSDSLDALLSRAQLNDDPSTRIRTLQATLVQLEDPNAPNWLLPQACRNLTGAARSVAIKEERERIAARLHALIGNQAPQL